MVWWLCLLYTSDAADDTPCVDLGGRRIIKKKVEQNMKIELFGHPLNPRALVTFPVFKSAKFYSG